MTDWGTDDEQDGIEAEPIDVDDDVERIDDAPRPGSRLCYGSVDEFVREYLRHVYRRRIDGRHRVWAGEWWRYDEALIRLEALWRAWEHLRLDPSMGMSLWWRDHADHHMAILMDPDGPFADAIDGETNTCKRGEPLPYVAPPVGMFPDLNKGFSRGTRDQSMRAIPSIDEPGGSQATPWRS